MPSRLNWCVEQENLLKVLREEEKVSSWKKIAQILNQKFVDSSRSGKQCRDRYINYVRFNQECPKIIVWSCQEDKLLFKKFQQYGAKWVQISSEMAGRSQNNLKNRFYGAMRKIMRKIVKVQKEMKPKPKKSIKQKQLIKIFEQCRIPSQSEKEQAQPSAFSQLKTQLYQKLLNIAISQQQQITTEQVKAIITMLHKYNSHTNKSFLRKKTPLQSSTTESISKQSSQLMDQISVHNQSQQQQQMNVAQKQYQCMPTVNEVNYYNGDSSLVSWGNGFADRYGDGELGFGDGLGDFGSDWWGEIGASGPAADGESKQSREFAFFF